MRGINRSTVERVLSCLRTVANQPYGGDLRGVFRAILELRHGADSRSRDEGDNYDDGYAGGPNRRGAQ